MLSELCPLLYETVENPDYVCKKTCFSNGILWGPFIEWFVSLKDEFTIKPWPNRDASWRKLKTWVNLRLCLARACVHLWWLAMTCVPFGRDQICMQFNASLSPFGHPTQVNTSWVTSINLLLANKIEVCLKMSFFATCVHLRRNLRAVWPPNATLYANSTCVHLQLLVGPFGQGLIHCI